MIRIIDPCSSHTPEPTSSPAPKGADIHHCTVPASIPAGTYHRLHHFPVPDDTGPAKATRMNPVIWQARRELISRGLVAIPVRKSNTTVLDLIAWDSCTLYGIAVRRSRTEAGVKEITACHNTLIRDLRSLRTPGQAEIQLWICIAGLFHVYRVLPGGLMSRGMP